MTRSNNKVLKIRAAKLDDTGTFACRGVNGFGKAQVNIHLLVLGKSIPIRHGFRDIRHYMMGEGDTYLHNYFNFHICLFIQRRRYRQRHVPLLSFQFLQSYHKVSLIKVAWYALRVKNMQSWSLLDSWGP